MEISDSDRFVIASSQTLIASSADRLPFEDIKARLELVREQLGNESLPYPNVAPRNLLEIAG